MNSMLDSLTWGEETPAQRAECRAGLRWLRRASLVLTALFVLAVLMSS
jgi:hypothetical protein